VHTREMVLVVTAVGLLGGCDLGDLGDLSMVRQQIGVETSSIRVGDTVQLRCEADEQGVRAEYRDFNADDVINGLARGEIPILLISTYRLHKVKAPHWVAASRSLSGSSRPGTIRTSRSFASSVRTRTRSPRRGTSGGSW